MDLTKKQTETLDILEDFNNGVREVIYGGSASSGKTIIGCYWILKQCMQYAGGRFGLARSELKTLKRTTLVSFFKVCKMQGLEAGVHYNYKEQAGEIHFFNGSVVILLDVAWQPSDADYDRLGSIELTSVFVDEIAQIRKKAWDVLITRIRYKLDEFKIKGKILGSLNPSNNWVYTFFYKPWSEGILERSKRFIQALPTDNPHNTEDYLEALRTRPKKEADRLYWGKWEAGSDDQLVLTDRMYDLFTNTFVIPTGLKYITADVARKGKDKSVIFVWDGMNLIKKVEYKTNSITQLGDDIKDLAKEYSIPMSRVIADESGVGGGLVDYIRCKGFVGGSKALNNENYINLRTQCFYRLADVINANEMYIRIKVTEDFKACVIQELEQIIQASDMDSETKLKIISKDEIKSNIGRSPDYSDTLSMRMWFELTQSSGVYSFG